jgi:hypothetical protein
MNQSKITVFIIEIDLISSCFFISYHKYLTTKTSTDMISQKLIVVAYSQ